MKVLEDQGFCTCCGKYLTYKFGEENFSLIDKSLNNYKKYKNLFVYKCENCGFVSTDITGTEGVLCGEIKDTYEFKQLLNCGYMENLNKEFEETFESVLPVGMYEAYSLILLEAKDYQKYVRLIAMVIEMKQALKRKYKDYCDEVEGNAQSLKKLLELIDKSIETNKEQIDHYFPYIENRNIFDELINLENLIGMNKFAEAQVLLKSANEKKRLEFDLIKYFETKIAHALNNK